MRFFRGTHTKGDRMLFTIAKMLLVFFLLAVLIIIISVVV